MEHTPIAVLRDDGVHSKASSIITCNKCTFSAAPLVSWSACFRVLDLSRPRTVALHSMWPTAVLVEVKAYVGEQQMRAAVGIDTPGNGYAYFSSLLAARRRTQRPSPAADSPHEPSSKSP